MKHFYLTANGDQKNSPSVSASPSSSISCHARTFFDGLYLKLYCSSDSKGNKINNFEVYRTSGTLGDREGQSFTLLHSFSTPFSSTFPSTIK